MSSLPLDQSLSDLYNTNAITLRSYLNGGCDHPGEALTSVSQSRVHELEKVQSDRLGCLSAIRGSGKTAENLGLLVRKKLKRLQSKAKESPMLEKKCVVVTKVPHAVSQVLMPMLNQTCLEMVHSGSRIIPRYDATSEMIMLCNVCDDNHVCTQATDTPNMLPPFPCHEFAQHRGIVGIFSAGAADAAVMYECANVLRLNGVTVKVYPRWTVQRVTHDFIVPDIMEECDVVIVVAGGEGTFPNIVGGLTTKPVIGIPTGTPEASTRTEVLCVMMNNCVPGIAVCNVDDGFNAAMQALSILRRRNVVAASSPSTASGAVVEYKRDGPKPCFDACCEELRKVKLEGIKEESVAMERVLDVRKHFLVRNSAVRTGVANLLGGQKPAKQILEELSEIYHSNSTIKPVYATRVQSGTFAEVQSEFDAKARTQPQPGPTLHYDEAASICWLEPAGYVVPFSSKGNVGVLSAGTADKPMVSEVRRILELNGINVHSFTDIGVNKIVRSMNHIDKLADMDVLIVAAGMEGTLPGFISSFTNKPVIALPTHIGYGTNKGGMTPMWAMLSSSSVGMVVVNVDNGFGAAMYALSVLRTVHPPA